MLLYYQELIMNSFIARANISNNRFSPQLKLDGQWEVALYDMALHNRKPNRKNTIEKIITKSDFPTLSEVGREWSDQHVVLFMVRINFDRMVRRSFLGGEREVDFLEPGDVDTTIKLRKAFKAFQYGNNRGFGTQSSPFDKWSYQLSSKTLLDTQEQYLAVSSQSLIDYWKRDSNRKLTITQLCDLLTNSLKPKLVKGRKYIETIFKNTTGKLIVTQPPYFYAPEIKYVNGFVNITTPWYVYKVYLHPEFQAIVNFPSLDRWGDWYTIFERELIRVPNYLRGTQYLTEGEGGTLYEFNTEKYYIRTPTTLLQHYIVDDNSDDDSMQLLKIKVPHILDETKVGENSESLLRITSWDARQVYKEFKVPLYVALRYVTIDDFNIEVTNSEGDKLIDGFVTLHFRKKYE